MFWVGVCSARDGVEARLIWRELRGGVGCGMYGVGDGVSDAVAVSYSSVLADDGVAALVLAAASTADWRSERAVSQPSDASDSSSPSVCYETPQFVQSHQQNILPHHHPTSLQQRAIEYKRPLTSLRNTHIRPENSYSPPNATTKAKADRVRLRVHLVQRKHALFPCAADHGAH